MLNIQAQFLNSFAQSSEEHTNFIHFCNHERYLINLLKMLSRALVLIFLLLATLASCDNTPTTQKTVLRIDTTHVQDTMLVIQDSSIITAFKDSIPLGAFQGTDVNSPGSLISILFSQDHKYKEQMKMPNGQVLSTNGVWERRDGRILLTMNNVPVLKFSLRKDTLYTLQNNNKWYKDSTQLILKKRNLASESGKWKSQQAQGIDFIGNGTDPSWSLEIDSRKMILFKPADFPKPVIVAVENPVITKDSSYYSIPAEHEKLNITIIPQFYGDGSTDLLYDNKVVVRYKGVIYKGGGITLNKL